MEFITEAISALFVASLFFGVLLGIISIFFLAVVGLIRGIKERSSLKFITSIVIFTVVYVGINTLVPKINTESTQSETQNIENIEFIRDWVFNGEDVVIEPAHTQGMFDEYNVYNVITTDNVIYVLTLYKDEAFGLNRYKLEYFNEDTRNQ